MSLQICQYRLSQQAIWTDAVLAGIDIPPVHRPILWNYFRQRISSAGAIFNYNSPMGMGMRWCKHLHKNGPKATQAGFNVYRNQGSGSPYTKCQTDNHCISLTKTGSQETIRKVESVRGYFYRVGHALR
ncbi:hypothetical protein PoB_007003100 [Plakobranchus ocellatus]|uniref:SCP domain-containing protein n=1 Tax=Plakobranchus ocellatus TaxID=259542 RepID=A0AAV4DHA6_9GAST|nr:hypothetical protein PoB_007003100 [Plakobranchus ocellatus]